MKKSTKKSTCPNCEKKDAIESNFKLTDDGVEIKIHKCPNCDHAPGIKELADYETKTNP
jgi:ribosomal protein S27AE